MLDRIASWLFPCHHAHTTFPQGRYPLARVTCLDCGREFGYDLRTWTRGTAQPTTAANVLRAVLHAGGREV